MCSACLKYLPNFVLASLGNVLTMVEICGHLSSTLLLLGLDVLVPWREPPDGRSRLGFLFSFLLSQLPGGATLFPAGLLGEVVFFLFLFLFLFSFSLLLSGVTLFLASLVCAAVFFTFFAPALFLSRGLEVVLLAFASTLESLNFFVVSEVADLLAGDWARVAHDGCESSSVVVGGMFVWEAELCG